MVPYCVRNVDQLRERVADFNKALEEGQQEQNWKRMVRSAKYFVYDKSTKKFGLNKFVAYYQGEGEYSHVFRMDLDEYWQLACPPGDRKRKTSPIDGKDAREGIEKNLSLYYAPFDDFPENDRRELEREFCNWFTNYFSQDRPKAKEKCHKCSFIII